MNYPIFIRMDNSKKGGKMRRREIIIAIIVILWVMVIFELIFN